MKKFIILLLAIGLTVSCKKENSDKNFELKGNIQGFKSGKLILQRLVDTNLVAIDSIIVDGESDFIFELDLKSPEMLYLFIDRGVSNSLDNNLQFFAEPGQMSINTDLEKFYLKAKISGSKNHKIYEDFLVVNKKFNNQLLDLTVAKFNAIKNKKSTDSLEGANSDVVKRKYLHALNFAINNKEFEVAPYIAITEIDDINLKYLEMIRVAMSPKVAQSLYGKKLIKLYDERKKAGL